MPPVATDHRAARPLPWRSSIIVAFQTALMAGGVLPQTLHGYYDFEPHTSASSSDQLADHVLLAALAMTIHVLVNQKYIGHMLVLMASAFRVGGPSNT